MSYKLTIMVPAQTPESFIQKTCKIWADVQHLPSGLTGYSWLFESSFAAGSTELCSMRELKALVPEATSRIEEV